MAAWKGIVGTGFSAGDFDSYARQITFGLWRPSFVVLHNTARPRFDQWHATPGVERMQNLV